MVRTSLRLGLAAVWPMQEITGANRLNALAPGSNILVQTGGVVQVAGPGPQIPFAAQPALAQNSYLYDGNDAALPFSGPFSMNWWQQTTLLAYQKSLVQIGNHGGNPALLYIQGGTPGHDDLIIGGVSVDSTIFPQWQTYDGRFPIDATWRMVTFTLDSVKARLYIDCLLAAEISWPLPMPVGPYDFSFGGNVVGATGNTVAVAQLSLWDRIITAYEMQVLLGPLGKGLSWPF